MNYSYLLVRCGELFLKGKNRPFFEKRLATNISLRFPGVLLERTQGRFILPYSLSHLHLLSIFGIVSYSTVLRCLSLEGDILESALELLSGKKGTFRIECKRSDKRFNLNSLELAKKAGEFIEAKTALVFSRQMADVVLQIEINSLGTFLFTEIIPCFGGLPVGCEGKVALFVEDRKSILAGILMMKRGVRVVPFVLHQMDLSLIKRYDPLLRDAIFVSSFYDFEKKASDEGLLVGVKGDTLQEWGEEKIKGITLLRPLVAYDEKRIDLELSLFNFQQT